MDVLRNADVDVVAPAGILPSEAPDVLSLLLNAESKPAFFFAHPDDSVFSAFVALSHSRGNALDIVICGGCPPTGEVGWWDQASGFHSPGEAHEVRIAEHRDACDALGVRSLVLDVLDSQYTGGASGNWEAALPTAESHLRVFGAGMLVTHTQGICHADHTDVSTLAAMLGRQLGIPIVEVCDRPYVQCSHQRCSGTSNEAPGQRITIRLSLEQWRNKCQFVACYMSQRDALGTAFGKDWCSRQRLGWECYALTFTPAA